MASHTTPQPPVLPPALLLAYIATVAAAGILANFCLITSLLRPFKSGVHTIVTQLAVADLILLICGAPPEVWCYNVHEWRFGPLAWIVHRGCKVLAATATLYLTMTISFHALALEKSEWRQTTRRKERTIEDEEIRCSQRSLVTDSNSSTPPRTMNVEYRTSTVSVPTALPSALVWVLAISVSVPEFALAARTFENDLGVRCSDLHSTNKLNIYTSLTTLDTLIPAIILCIACVFIVGKLCSKRRTRGSVERGESLAVMKLSLCLAAVFALLHAPQNVVSVYRTHWSEDTTIGVNDLVLSCLQLTAPLLRPLISFAILPRLRGAFNSAKDVNGEFV